MKRMITKRGIIISIIFMLLLAFSVTGCSIGNEEDKESEMSKSKKDDDKDKKKDKKDKKKKDFDIDELKENGGLMFSSKNSNYGECNHNEDYWENTTYEVYYDGTIVVRESYNLSGECRLETTLSDKDYKKIYLFASDAAENKTYEDIRADGTDGDGWSFTFYNIKGKEYEIYRGYTYKIDELEDIEDILMKYRDESSMIFQEGSAGGKTYQLYVSEHFIENDDYDVPEEFYFDNAANIVDELSKSNPGENVIYSDTSLNMALGILSEGAAGDTREDILAYLQNSGYEDDIVKVRERNNGLINSFMTENIVVCSLANGVFLDDELALDYSYEIITGMYYNTFCQQFDFQEKSNIEIINEWCKSNTNGHITDIISPDKLQDSKVIIANALYFNGKWLKEFEEDNIKKEEFTNLDGSTKEVSMMSEYNLPTFYENEYATGFAKFYEGNRYVFFGILPKEEGDFNLSDLDMESLIESEESGYQVDIKIPEFVIEDENSLLEPLENAGLASAFGTKADYSNLCNDSVGVSDVVQKIYVDVNAKGTEAAAVTDIEVGETDSEDAADRDRYIYLDRPFAFMIYDIENKECLFIGKIVNL